MESVSVLGSYLNHEITLIQQAAKNREIIEWFADEDNTEKRAAAFQRMMHFADMLQINGLYFVIKNSLHEYSIDAGISIDKFIPIPDKKNSYLPYSLNPDILYDQWFFTAVASDYDFTLNLDIDKITNTRRLWINHKVINNGEVTGILCSALQFDEVYDELFGNYDSNNVLGFIIDKNGIIQISSDIPEPDFLHIETTIYDMEEKRHIFDVYSAPIFVSEISSYLNTGNQYNQKIEPSVVKFSSGNYQYLSIAPIPNTNWLTITFFNSRALFDVMNMIPLLIVVILAFGFYILLNSLSIRHLVLNPLGKLTHSVSESDYNIDVIFGTNRNDEIGELARTTRRTWKRLNENTISLMSSIKDRERQTQILHAVNSIAASLFSAESEAEFKESLPEGMQLLAGCIDIDRAFIWRNEIIDGILCYKLIHEWVSEIGKINNKLNVGHVYTYPNDAPKWLESFLKDECVYGSVTNMPENEKRNLEQNGVKSILAVPVHLHGQFWGFVSYDNCQIENILSQDDIDILRSGSLLIGNAFLRYDITQNLKDSAEEAKAASRSKSSFLANMSHEIRTPMNSIIGFSELALDDELPSKTRDYITKIKNNSDWLLQIINDILDISKIESGKMELESIPVDLHEIFTSCRTLILPKALEKGLTLYFYAEPSIDKILYSDPTRLRQVLVNLLSNAVKFTNSGEIKMKVSIKETAEDSVTLHFEIIDSGIGITETQMAKIFDPFVQAETGITRKYGGSGLGLPITKNIIEMMGGELFAESKPGAGSKFSFSLTFKAANITDNKNPAERVIFDDIERPVFEGEILLCEDNGMNQQVICEHLERVGFKTVVAKNGKKGVELVKRRLLSGEKQFDMILMDIHMPVMDGLEAASRIISINASIPIVAMTANVMVNDREIYKANGMNDCIAKPFTSQELWRCLMRYFNPVSWQRDYVKLQELAERELRIRLINSFLESNHKKIDDINDAINSGDIKLAHRLAHTLKGNAGQLNKTRLQQAAKDVEQQLKDGENLVTLEQMETLEKEFNSALKELVRDSMQSADVSSLYENFDNVLNNSDTENSGRAAL